MATQQTRLESLAAAVGGAVKTTRNRLPPLAGTAGLPLVKTNSASDGAYAPAKLDLAAINAPANSDGLYLKFSGGVLVAAAAPAGGGSGTTYTAGDGIAISGSTIAIDAAKVARKDVGQTFAGDQSFTGFVHMDYLRSNSGEGTLDLYGGYLTLQSEYGIQIGNGNTQVNFYDSVNFNTDVFYGGEHLTSVFAPRYAIYENRTASFTLGGYMAGATIRLTSSSTTTITIPANGSDYIPIGAVCSIQRGGTGAVIFSPASGVTLEAAGGILSIPERYGLVDLVKTDTNAWTMVARVPFNSPAFTGTPTAPTAASSDSSTTIATTAFVNVALATALVPREITYEMFHPNHGGIAQFYHAPVAESVRVSPIYGNIGYSIAAAFGTGAPSWGAVTYLNAGSQATVSIPAGGTMRLELSGDAQGIPRWCHVKRLSGGS